MSNEGQNIVNTESDTDLLRPGQFRFVDPVEPISNPNFKGAFWGDLEIPAGLSVIIEGAGIVVQVFGFQSLVGEGARVGEHEEKMWEMVYPLVGRADMTVIRPGEHPMIAYMGVNPLGFIDITKAVFKLEFNGALSVTFQDLDTPVEVFPVVTPAGARHETVGESENFIYLVVKGMPIPNPVE